MGRSWTLGDWSPPARRGVGWHHGRQHDLAVDMAARKLGAGGPHTSASPVISVSVTATIR
jgi:hypothetical protein